MKQFYNKLNIRTFKIGNKPRKDRRILNAIEQILCARSYLDDCISIFKSNFELEQNSYIQQASKEFKSYQGFIVYLGISNARLDVLTEKLQEIERKTDTSGNPISLTWIETYKVTLIHYMNAFIIYPIIHASQKFSRDYTVKKKVGEDEEEFAVVKDDNWFFYLLFLEVYRASEVEGALARQSIFAGKTSGFKAIEQIDTRTPPLIPTNAQLQEPQESEGIQSLSDNFQEDKLYSEDDVV